MPVCARAGADALDLLHRLSTNDLKRARTGQVVRTILTTEKGRMIDLVTIAVLEDGLLLFVSRGNEHHFQRWIEKFTITEDITLDGSRAGTTELACLVGPRCAGERGCPCGTCRARGRDRRRPGRDARRLTRRHRERPVGMGRLSAERERIRQRRSSSSKTDAAMPASPSSAETTSNARASPRARPAFGSEISEAFTPHDAGLAEFISTTKGCYVGQEVLARMVTYQKARKGLIGFTSALPLPEAGGKAAPVQG